MSRRIRANSGDALSSSVPSGSNLFLKYFSSSPKSAISADSAITAGHSVRISTGGCSVISRPLGPHPPGGVQLFPPPLCRTLRHYKYLPDLRYLQGRTLYAGLVQQTA